MKSRKEILEKHRKKDPSLPHWITIKHAEQAMKEYTSKLIISKEKNLKKNLTSLVNDFTGGTEPHTPILVYRIYELFKRELNKQPE